jgi:hypothetical protein
MPALASSLAVPEPPPAQAHSPSMRAAVWNLFIAKSLGVRLVEADHVRTTLPNYGSNVQTDLRLSAGIGKCGIARESVVIIVRNLKNSTFAIETLSTTTCYIGRQSAVRAAYGGC